MIPSTSVIHQILHSQREYLCTVVNSPSTPGRGLWLQPMPGFWSHNLLLALSALNYSFAHGHLPNERLAPCPNHSPARFWYSPRGNRDCSSMHIGRMRPNGSSFQSGCGRTVEIHRHGVLDCRLAELIAAPSPSPRLALTKGVQQQAHTGRPHCHDNRLCNACAMEPEGVSKHINFHKTQASLSEPSSSFSSSWKMRSGCVLA